jgi:hypothetical protein
MGSGKIKVEEVSSENKRGRREGCKVEHGAVANLAGSNW